MLAVDPSLRYLLGDHINPREVWTIQFQRKTWPNKLFSLKLKEGGSDYPYSLSCTLLGPVDVNYRHHTFPDSVQHWNGLNLLTKDNKRGKAYMGSTLRVSTVYIPGSFLLPVISNTMGVIFVDYAIST